jgi:hypothetical protein
MDSATWAASERGNGSVSVISNCSRSAGYCGSTCGSTTAAGAGVSGTNSSVPSVSNCSLKTSLVAPARTRTNEDGFDLRRISNSWASKATI